MIITTPIVKHATPAARFFCMLLIWVVAPWVASANDSSALLAFYHSTNHFSWRSACRWSLPPNCTSYGITCNGDSRVTRVDLPTCNISGTLPPELSSMSALLVIRLNSNGLTGTLPSQWSNLSSLRDMYLYANSLTGTLPNAWSSMSALQTIDLALNQITGTLPPEWSDLQLLENLYVSSNQVSGTLPPEWSNMISLQYVYLSNNSICGNVPFEWRLLPAAVSGIVNLTLNSITVKAAAWYKTPQYESQVAVLPTKVILDTQCNLFRATRSATAMGSRAVQTSLHLGLSVSRSHTTTPLASAAAASTGAIPSLLDASSTLSANGYSDAQSATAIGRGTVWRSLRLGLSASRSHTTTPLASTAVVPSLLDASSTLSPDAYSGAQTAQSETAIRRGGARTSLYLPLSVSLSHIATRSAVVATTTVTPSLDAPLTPSAATSASASHAQTQLAIVTPIIAFVAGGTAAGAALLIPSAALSAQRLSLVARLADCSTNSEQQEDVNVAESPLQLNFGPASNAAHRGAVVGNVFVWCLSAVAGFLVTVALRLTTARAEGIVAIAARLRLPGLFFIAVALLLQQVVVSSVLLVDGASLSGWADEDIGIGCAGLCVVFVVCALLARVLNPRAASFRAAAVPTKNSSKIDGWTDVVRWLTAPTTSWRPRDKVRDALFVQRYGFLFEGCKVGRQWWLLVEVAVTVVLSVLGGIEPSSGSGCEAVAWLAVAVCGLLLTLVIALRPMCSHCETCIVALLAGGQLSVALCGALDAPPEAARVLGLVSAVVAALLVAVALLSVVVPHVRRLKVACAGGSQLALKVPDISHSHSLSNVYLLGETHFATRRLRVVYPVKRRFQNIEHARRVVAGGSQRLFGIDETLHGHSGIDTHGETHEATRHQRVVYPVMQRTQNMEHAVPAGLCLAISHICNQNLFFMKATF